MSAAEYEDVLSFWFDGCEQDAPHIDARMDRWFGNDARLDDEIGERFGTLVAQASNGKLDHWADEPRGRLALIILIDQFRRNIHRGTAEAFSRDGQALKFCVDGIVNRAYKKLRPEEQIFFFMPLQHAESSKLQDKSVSIYRALANKVSETQRETFMTTAQFAELHRDIVEQFGRFPHRNRVLGRENTEAEEAYLANEGVSFGQ
ncbi:MAG: DUF924 domain-containing protein [Chromatiales bacterium]|nr:MAG: DUF924 domain-containing protein [Chromatiales bacterium]